MALPVTRSKSRQSKIAMSVHGVVHNLAVDDGQTDFSLLIASSGTFGIEVVVAQDHDVGELARLDRAERGFLLQEPAVLGGVQPQRFRRVSCWPPLISVPSEFLPVTM